MPCIFENVESSDVIAICAVVIALLSMFATYYQARIARAHSRISVRPHLDWTTNRVLGSHPYVELENHGLGPAFVKSITCTFGGKAFDFNFELPDFLLLQFTKLPFTHTWEAASPGTPLAAGRKLRVLSFCPDPANSDQCNQARELIARFDFTVKYSSAYDEHFEVVQHK